MNLEALIMAYYLCCMGTSAMKSYCVWAVFDMHILYAI